jgi:hypothetical protein
MHAFFKENKRPLAILFAITLFLSLLPVYEVVRYLGDDFKGVPPSYIDDNYYYVRMKEVVDGYPMLGNPYFFEHREDIAPAFVLPDWISALPLYAGMSLMQTVSINFSFWSLVFVLLTFLLFRTLKLSPYWSSLGAAFVYSQVYLLVLRPVSMQLVFPVFLLFLLTFFLWEREPTSLKRKIYFAFAIALTFYDYTYLWQIVTVFIGLYLIFLVWKKDKNRLLSYISLLIAAAVAVIPMIMFTMKQLHHPDYWQTMVRTGLVFTHIPTFLVFTSGIWAVFLSFALYLSGRWIATLRHDEVYTTLSRAIIIAGVSIVIVSGSNIITGAELETAGHVERFLILWLSLGSVILTYHLFVTRKELFRTVPFKRITLLACFVLVLIGNLNYAGDLSTFFHPHERVANLRRLQEYIAPLDWLDAREQEPVVVWTATRSYIATILPEYTKHYLLFAGAGVLQLVSDDEVAERFLTAASIEDMTPERLSDEVRQYKGVAYAYHIVNTNNRKVRICNALHLPALGVSCGSLTDARTFNAPLVAGMWRRYQEEIKPNLANELKKFHVRYVMKDKQEDHEFHPELLTNINKVYEDTRFVIYELPKE